MRVNIKYLNESGVPKNSWVSLASSCARSFPFPFFGASPAPTRMESKAPYAAVASSSSAMSFKIDAKQHFIKVQCKAECMPPSQVISLTLKQFPNITRAYHLGDYATLCTLDEAHATTISEFAKKLAASPPMATHRLYVSSIGGLPKEAVKTLCERFGEVEEVLNKPSCKAVGAPHWAHDQLYITWAWA